MPFIVVKHPIVKGFAADMHQNIPAQVPPLGPPPGTPQPIYPSVLIHHIPNTEAIFGKWTDASMVADGLGVCLWQHDWGVGLIHVSIPLNPQCSIAMLGSSLKLQLPASTSHEAATGGALHAGSKAPHAACFSNGFIVAQCCWDRGGFPFVAPTGFHFSSPSTVLVDVRVGDVWAAVLGMAGDCLATMAGGMFGKRFSSLFGQGASAAFTALFGASTRNKVVGQLIIGLGTIGGIVVTPVIAELLRDVGVGAGAAGTETILGRVGQGMAAMGLVLGSAICDWGAESVQGTGDVLGEDKTPPPAGHSEPSPSPDAGPPPGEGRESDDGALGPGDFPLPSDDTRTV